MSNNLENYNIGPKRCPTLKETSAESDSGVYGINHVVHNYGCDIETKEVPQSSTKWILVKVFTIVIIMLLVHRFFLFLVQNPYGESSDERMDGLTRKK